MPALENAKHEAFARAIVEGKSGREAYRGAGYKPKTDGAADACASRLLAGVKVAARVAELKAAAAEMVKFTAGEVLAELARIGFANMLDYVRIVDGDPVIDFSALTRDQAAAISSIEIESYVEPGDGSEEAQEPQAHGGSLKRKKAKGREVKRVKFKLHDKRAALVDLGKHFGLFNGGRLEKPDDNKPDDRPLTDLDAARRVAFLLTKASREAPPAPAAAKKEKAA